MYDHQADLQLVEKLNAPNAADRLSALAQIQAAWDAAGNPPSRNPQDVNNHIHTSYSFSPYSPTKAVYMACMAGLSTAGIIDHDSVSGTEEFIQAGAIARLPVTIGWEMRVSMEDTPFADKRINNPDQRGNLYVTIHGLPHSQLSTVKAFLAPIHAARGLRNRAMVENINGICAPLGIALDYDRDVLPLSNASEGGSVTERHLLFALALKLISVHGQGASVVNALQNTLGLSMSEKITALLSDGENPYYAYDLLGLLKAELVSKIYIDANNQECIDVRDYLAFVREVGGLSCAAYLGDVGDSVTGDKKAQKFEDDYLEALFAYYAELGFDGISYMPSRNTAAQLRRVRSLCKQHNLLEISGEDINQPRQSFVCEAARAPEFANLIESTWALIGSELAGTDKLEDSMSSLASKAGYPSLDERVAAFAKIGRTYYNQCNAR